MYWTIMLRYGMQSGLTIQMIPTAIYWGYVLTMGTSEGNLHALWSARNDLCGRYVQESDSLSTRQAVVSKPPVVFFSQYGNYSLHKLCDTVNISTFYLVGREVYPDENPLGGEWPVGVPCTGGDAGAGIYY